VGALAALLICVPLQVLFMLAYDFSDRYAVESWVWKFGMWTLFAGVPTLLALWIGWWAAGVLRSRVNPIP
jgi:hypothetical protein